MPDFDQFVAEMESGKWDESRNEVTGMRSRARLWVGDRGFHRANLAVAEPVSRLRRLKPLTSPAPRAGLEVSQSWLGA
jgi:hypothetical protein